MEEINLDFLESPPSQSHQEEQSNTPFVFNEFAVKLDKKKYASKRFEMAQTIARVDDLVQEIDRLKSQNIQLQQQLKGFHATAQQVQELYINEKKEHSTAKFNLDRLEKEYHKIDVDLINMSMLNGQLKARLADYDGRPINFDSLVVKYVKIINKLDGHDILKYYSDKDLVEKLRDYCAAMKLKIPAANSPKKPRSRGNKAKTHETAVQCRLLEEISLSKHVCLACKNKPKVADQNIQCDQTPQYISTTIKQSEPVEESSLKNYDCPTCKTKPKVEDQNTQCSTTKRDKASQYISTIIEQCDQLEDATHKTKPKVQDQNTQCSTAKRNQSSQYISTMITRQTNTEKIVHKHVQTMFPEPPAIDDILKVYSRWSNIRSVSPLLSPSRTCSKPNEMVKKLSTTGTCTMLCNIRRKIDYLPLNNSSNIKQEIFTPSVSPTSTPYNIKSRSRMNSISSNVPGNINSSLLNLFNSNNSSLEHLSPNTFNDLWQIFGKMLLSLLQTSTTGIGNTPQNSPLNQQEFLHWLMELYMNSQPQNTYTVQTQTLENSDLNVSTSPLIFNNTSALSANVLRPEPQKSLPEENIARTNMRENESIILNPSANGNNSFKSQVPIADTSNNQLESHSHDNSINREVQQIPITSNTNELHTTKICESNLHKLHQTNTSEDRPKSIKKTNFKDTILDQMQELLPEIHLNKKKRKALKKLLKSNNNFKKAFKTRKNKPRNKESSVVVLTKEHNDDDAIETAVDFLKTFAMTQQSNQSLDDNFSETERNFLKQISNENVSNNVSNNLTSEEFAFIKPSGSLTHTHLTLNTSGDFVKLKKSKSSQQMEEKYQLLFGESDSEAENEEMETENLEFNPKSVIKSTATAKLVNSHSKCDLNDMLGSLNYKKDCISSAVVGSSECDLQHFGRQENVWSSVENNLNETQHAIVTAPHIPTQIIDSVCNFNPGQETSTTDVPTSILNNASQLENAKDSEYFHLHANKKSVNTSSKTNICDSELSSDSNSARDDKYLPKINEISEVKAKLNKKDIIIKEIKGVYDINNYTEKVKRKREICELYTDEIPTLEHSLDKMEKVTPKNCIESLPNLTGSDSSNDSMDYHQIISTSSTLVEPNKSLSEKSIGFLTNLNEDDSSSNSTNSYRIITTPEPKYSSDFEKDFELSSESESENDLAIHKFSPRTIEEPKDNDFFKEKVSEKDSSGKDKSNIKPDENFEQQHQKYNKSNNFEESLNIFESNYLNKPKRNVSKNQIEPEDDNTSIATPGKEKGSLESINNAEHKDFLKNFVSNYPNESKVDNISFGLTEEEEQFNTILNCTTKEQKVLKISRGEHISELNFEDGSPEQIWEKNSSQATTLKDVAEKSHINTKNTIENENMVENETKSSSAILHYPENESTNPSKCEGNSSVWSAITALNSTLNDKTLNINEIIQTPNKKNDNGKDPTESSLSTLKLLDLNKIGNQQKLSHNLMRDAKPIKAVNIRQDKSNKDTIFKAENSINSPDDEFVTTNINNNKMFEYSSISKINQMERVTILSCSTITKSLHSENDIKDLICKQDFNIVNQNDSETTPTCIKVPNISYQNYLNEQDNCAQVMKSAIENLEVSDIGSISNNVSHSSSPMDTVDELDLSDSLPLENALIIDEESYCDISKQLKTEHLNNSILTESSENCDDTINSSNISTLLNSTLYNEVLTESLKPIVNDLLQEELVSTSISAETKPKRGRKRKNEFLAELQPCKRSQRLIAKQEILEESLNISKTNIELGKYTNRCKNVINNMQIKSPIKKDIKKKYFQPKCETIENSNLVEHKNPLQIGFFRERAIEENATIDNNKTFIVTKTQNPEAGNEKMLKFSYEIEKPYKQEQHDQLFLETEKQKETTTVECGQERDKFNSKTVECEMQKNKITTEIVQERGNCNGQTDCISIEPFEIFIYSDSPQSPAQAHTNNEDMLNTFVVIPLERPPHLLPKNNAFTLFDVLIKSYKSENQKHVLESITSKDFKRKECILNKVCEEIKLYCYNEMELDLYCTSKSAINKLLSISPDYNLIQKALIKVAQNAERTNMLDNDLPSIIQEMPPHHLSKCLQRLFVFLKNIVTRNNNFCEDLINKIESLLFNSKQTENLSLQATLNLTQLYLMSSKVQEYLQLAKHPARLFIAKCLYFYLQKSVPMIHEVLMWYPTVLPYREDKTYDRSDALISVIQQILMSTKYEMDKTDLRGKMLLSKLRYEYHFEPFKPTTEEVINVLIEKLKNSKFYNISLAFGLLCKRMGVLKTQHVVLNQHLIPLANEYYSLALKSNEYDKRIAVLLEVISILIKPLPIETDTQKYFSEFSRFLNGFERQLIQEAALCSLLRMQRFNVECIYNLLRHFQPTYNLNTHTQAMLKTFLYRRPLTFWKNLKSQNPKNFN